MSHVRKFIMLMVIVLIVGVRGTDSAAGEESAYLFAYLFPKTSVLTEIHLINPVSGYTTISPVSINHASDEQINDATLSPDGKWLVYRVEKEYNYYNNFVMLVNLETGTSQQLSIYMDLMNSFDWSPDSTKFTYVVHASGEGGPRPEAILYIYDVQTQTQTEVKHSVTGTPSIMPYQVVWTPNSQKFAIINEWAFAIPVTYIFELYDLQTGLITHTLNNRDYAIEGSPDQLCIHNWSPDASYLAFEYFCDIGGKSDFNDLFVWDISQNVIRRITYYSELHDQLMDNVFSSSWLDNENIILGITAQPWNLDASLSIIETYVYNIPTESKYSLLTNSLGEIKNNPLDDSIAIQIIQFVLDEGQLLIETAHVEVGRIVNRNYAPIQVVGIGCNFQWSPDGQLLAFRVRDSQNVYSNLYCTNKGASYESLVFLNADLGTSYQFDLPENENIKPLGWVLSAGLKPSANE